MQTHEVADGRPVALVQLPFPSQRDPEPTLAQYYDIYVKLYRRLTPTYTTTDGDLWEAPLWVAHLDGAIARDDTTLVDLSRVAADASVCHAELCRRLTTLSYVLFSPLAQNFDVARATAQCLRDSGHVTVLGGNMVRLATPGEFDVVFVGQARVGLYEQIARAAGVIGAWPIRGTRQPEMNVSPRYRLLSGFASRVPLVRINASHGCLFACTFCGDGWSRQLHVVSPDELAREIEDIEATFPNISTVYVGDKTFGQSRDAVENLISAVARFRRRHQFIVQTHVAMVDDWLLDALDRLGVDVVELGFETADERMLNTVRKRGGMAVYRTALERLHDRGKAVVLNVLGGLPSQTERGHAVTVAFLRDTAEVVYLYNLYNFVPYPETPLFAQLQSRIVDWDFAHWREDMPPVFEPYEMSRDCSWELFLDLVRVCTDLCVSREQRSSSLESVVGA